MFRQIPLACVLMMAAALPGAAAPPPDVVADPAIAAWFKNLKQPGTGLPCCSVADCRRVANVRHPDGDSYEAFFEGEWHRVPTDAIALNVPNIIGTSVVCYTWDFGYSTLPGVDPENAVDRVKILCFFPAEPLS
jgi:hypothetical protein